MCFSLQFQFKWTTQQQVICRLLLCMGLSFYLYMCFSCTCKFQKSIILYFRIFVIQSHVEESRMIVNRLMAYFEFIILFISPYKICFYYKKKSKKCISSLRSQTLITIEEKNMVRLKYDLNIC